MYFNILNHDSCISFNILNHDSCICCIIAIFNQVIFADTLTSQTLYFLQLLSTPNNFRGLVSQTHCWLLSLTEFKLYLNFLGGVKMFKSAPCLFSEFVLFVDLEIVEHED